MNNGMNPFSTDEWIQQQQHEYPDRRFHGESSDHDTSIQLQVHKHNTDSSQRIISTNINNIGPKPIRSRRSRASRKAPTTVLNASPTDFRALVQRFTGCSETPNGVNSMGSASGSVSAPVVNLQKGPVNINFARKDDHHHMSSQSSSRYTYFDHDQNDQGGFDLQPSYGMETTNSIVYDQSIQQSSPTDHGATASHGYHV